MVWGHQDLGHHLCCFPGPTFSVCPSPPIFRCTNVWDTPASWGVGYRHLCWVTGIFLVVGWLGGIKSASYSAMMLMSLSRTLNFVGFGVQLSSSRTDEGSKSPMLMPSLAQPVLFRCLAQAGAARGSENRPVINFPAAGGWWF